jgi:hypothetical protein
MLAAETDKAGKRTNSMESDSNAGRVQPCWKSSQGKAMVVMGSCNLRVLKRGFENVVRMYGTRTPLHNPS